MSLCVLYMILCACAFMLNPQRARGDSREIPGLAAVARKTRRELLIQEMVSVLEGLLFQTRLSIQVFNPGAQTVMDVGGPVLPAL